MAYPPDEQREYAREYRQKHKKECAAYAREWRARNRAKARAIQNKHAAKRRAATLTRFDYKP